MIFIALVCALMSLPTIFYALYAASQNKVQYTLLVLLLIEPFLLYVVHNTP